MQPTFMHDNLILQRIVYFYLIIIKSLRCALYIYYDCSFIPSSENLQVPDDCVTTETTIIINILEVTEHFNNY